MSAIPPILTVIADITDRRQRANCCREQLQQTFGTALALAPAEFGKLLADETEKWGKVIRAANIKPE